MSQENEFFTFYSDGGSGSGGNEEKWIHVLM